MHDKSAPAVKPDLPVGKPSGFRLLVGYRAVVWREGYAEIELALTPDHMNSVGILHGGVYMTILDAAMGHATTWCSVPGHRRHCVTISLNTSFIAATQAGLVRASAQLLSIENRVGLCRGEIRDDAGKLLVVGQGSFRYARGSERLEGVPRS